MRAISKLIVRMAQDNPRWGYTRIQGALTNVGHKVGRRTIANVLKRHGLNRRPNAATHVVVNVSEGHWKMLSASDFLTVEVWTGRDLITFYVMFVISLADRVVTIGGITTRPDAARVWEPVRPRPRIPPQCFAAGNRRADRGRAMLGPG
jgi:hypothetical protein